MLHSIDHRSPIISLARGCSDHLQKIAVKWIPYSEDDDAPGTIGGFGKFLLFNISETACSS